MRFIPLVSGLVSLPVLYLTLFSLCDLIYGGVQTENRPEERFGQKLYPSFSHVWCGIRDTRHKKKHGYSFCAIRSSGLWSGVSSCALSYFVFSEWSDLWWRASRKETGGTIGTKIVPVFFLRLVWYSRHGVALLDMTGRFASSGRSFWLIRPVVLLFGPVVLLDAAGRFAIETYRFARSGLSFCF